MYILLEYLNGVLLSKFFNYISELTQGPMSSDIMEGALYVL